MEIIVQKFGGTSVGSIERIENVAKIVHETKKNGFSPVVVVSAMAGTTDQLLKQSMSFNKNNTAPLCYKEQDSIIAAGEQISAGLVALALHKIGLKARSWLGWQLPIITDENFGAGKIKNIANEHILNALHNDEIPVIAGFQGVFNNRIVTLGRGGTDTSAVAIAASLNAKRCDIYTDVEGVMSTDPRLIPNAKHIPIVSYEEMLEMAASGAKVVHPRAVEIAMRYNIPLQILSSFNPQLPGTLITGENNMIEYDTVTGVAATDDQVRFTLEDIENVPGVAAAIFAQLESKNINTDIIVQNVSKNQMHCDLTFTVSKRYKYDTLNTLQQINRAAFKNMTVDEDVAKISIIGIGLKKYSGIAQKMFHILAEQGINILVVSTSEIKISVLIKRQYMELALKCLHKHFKPANEEV